MIVRINGKEQAVPPGCSVAALLQHLKLAAQPCAVEVNKAIVPKRKHAEHAVNPGDTIEIVTLVGGG